MKKISRSNLPNKIPVFQTMTIVLSLKVFGASEMVWGIVITLWGLIFIGSVVLMFKQEEIDVFNREPKEELKKSNFQAKLKTAMEEAQKQKAS